VSLRIATYNIRKGGGRRAALIGDVLADLDPGVVVLQEATSAHVVDDLADRLGAGVVVRRRGWSVALLARAPVAMTRWHRLASGRSLLEAEIPDHDLRVLGVHLVAGMSRRFERRRERELDGLLAVAGSGVYAGRTLIAGDLNAVAPGDALAVASLPRWIRLLARIDGGIQTTVVARALDAGYVDCFRALHPAEPGPTLPAWAPTVRLDYLLASPAVARRAVACSVGVPGSARPVAASDHLPLLLELAAGADVRTLPHDD
jgi:endonuclease/exonuclease/phosphatase family metal-dependent hydrolase